jgi:hypothetical protein
MKVRATAIATDRSNAIGSLELECTPHGLVVVYLGVGAFRDGYAPAALTTGTRVTVPWPAVEAARVEGDRVYLELEPRLTPHSRVELASFSTGDYAHRREVSRQRWILWSGAFGTALALVMLSALTIPRIAPEAGAAAAAGVGAVTAALVLALGMLADRRIAAGGLDGDAAREAFAAELSHFLPNLVRLPRPAEPPPKPIALPTFSGLLPRATAGLVIALSASVLGALLTIRWVTSAPERTARARAPAAAEAPLAVEPPASEPAPPPATTAAPAAAAEPEPTNATGELEVAGKCACPRAASLLWHKPIPRLSALILSRRLIQAPFRKRLELEVAAVNNGDQELRDVTLRINFYEKEAPPSSGRHLVSHRAVYFQGPLAPGQAIKWSVEARGESIEIEHDHGGEIGAGGEGAASADQIAGLLTANHRPVRLHGAMLLAYLGDRRARGAAGELAELGRGEEAAYLGRVIAATGELRSCELAVTGSGGRRRIEACVFNAASEVQKEAGLLLRGLSSELVANEPTAAPPSIVTENRWRVPAELEPLAGLRVRTEVELEDSTPAAFEALADRHDLLP